MKCLFMIIIKIRSYLVSFYSTQILCIFSYSDHVYRQLKLLGVGQICFNNLIEKGIIFLKDAPKNEGWFD